MKLKCMFECIDMGDEIIAVPVGEGAKEIHGVLKVNKEGREIIELLSHETNEEMIIDILRRKHSIDAVTLAGYVHKTVEALKSSGLIDL